MHIENLEGLTRVLQTSISPVALISGVGLLLLSQTNRFSIVTDRLRKLAPDRRERTAQDPNVARQIGILLQRARVLCLAISAALICVLLASMMVLLIFAVVALGAAAQSLVLFLFALSLAALILSLLLYLWDMHLSLKAVEKLLNE